MPVITVYAHGGVGGTPPEVNDHERGKRDVVQGWSAQSIRSNTRFLYSVDETRLPALGFAVTLTLKWAPETGRDWHRMRRKLEQRLRKFGMVLMHWVTEWQRRGVPHLHAAIFFSPDAKPPRNTYPEGRSTPPEEWLPYAIIFNWQLVCSSEGILTRAEAQNVTPITAAVGWFQYQSKHAARGLQHYQRSPENIPPGWEKNTGRMWGKSGEWPLVEPRRFRLMENRSWWRFRRVVRGWRKADARKGLDHARNNHRLLTLKPAQYASHLRTAIRRIGLSRRMFKCGSRSLSEVRGYSEWIPPEIQLRTMAQLMEEGHRVKIEGWDPEY